MQQIDELRAYVWLLGRMLKPLVWDDKDFEEQGYLNDLESLLERAETDEQWSLSLDRHLRHSPE